jgi:hypothetical protein
MYYFVSIKGIKETENGTEVIIKTKESVANEILKNRILTAEIRLNDNRRISSEQRGKIYATIKDISMWTGDEPEYLKEFLKFSFCGDKGEEYFSLSDCSISVAREFITYIIDFVLKHNIPLSDIALNRTDDIDRYLYGCLKYRRCAITGRAGANIHHVEGSRIGMGRNRHKISHKGLELMALSSEWHDRVHREGEEEIFKNYKIYGITLDGKTLHDLGISKEDIS